MSNANSINTNRRQILLAGAGLASASMAIGAAHATETATQTAPATPSQLPFYYPRTEFVYEAIVDVDTMKPLGNGPLGERRQVAITGGTFEGPGLRGIVLPGGLDRQLIRRDGVKRLDALYEMQTDDGAIITVHNKVVVDESVTPRYAFSAIDITAPDGPYAWLNRLQFVGTLGSLRPKRQAVVIRVFKIV